MRHTQVAFPFTSTIIAMDIATRFSTIPIIMIHSTGAIHMRISEPPIILGQDTIAGLIEVMPDTIQATTTILGQV